MCFFYEPGSVQGQDANTLINEVNALRVSKGLSPYSIDASLSALAQTQSEYQASINFTTHNRPDGSNIPARSENVCGGLNVTASYCVNQMWTDSLHLYTMIGLDSGSVGAGAVTAADGSIYYTLLVNSTGNDTNLNLSPTLAVTAAVAANLNAASGFVDAEALPVQPGTFATSTSQPDGSIYHTVQQNETLWTIAINYGTTVAQLQALNNMAADDTSVIAGNRILIHYGGTPVSDTLTPTVTRPPATNTPRATSTITQTLPPLSSLTPTITNTPTPGPLIKHISFFDQPEARYLGLILVVISLIGLLITFYLGFLKK